MPVGVPKVPSMPLEPDESEIKNQTKPKQGFLEKSIKFPKRLAAEKELIDRLYRDRALFLFKDLDKELANTIVGLMVFLNLEDNTKEQFLFINSPGGSLVYGIAVHDVSRSVRPDVHTLAMGVAASMAAFILSGGAQTKRLAFPHRVMIHQPRCVFPKDSAPVDVGMDAEEVTTLRNYVVSHYAIRSRRSVWRVIDDLKRNTYMTPTEARTYGIVDSIAADWEAY
uniref:clp protease proteolytic subunit n=1 Tax=Asyneuma japonicum TaxID=103993 RepID=UPI002E7A2F70|nr:clp protease proteolytic subunit [Asyneuma japonicum]YP_011009039.1 clp protease proteolytic subunit [Asyneuma japonicum]WPV76253.1 clp protease proteolytic subunit [Asyneuma japonicum]WPV76291.1 clp protease proteolytic subunit [Asyneuma japonicum]